MPISRRRARRGLGHRARPPGRDRGPSPPARTERTITLLGDARPYAEVTLYAKVSGYLKSISVDRGDKVQAGQLVAEIDSAETDSLYTNAVADADNKRKLSQRNSDLLTRGNVSLQRRSSRRPISASPRAMCATSRR